MDDENEKYILETKWKEEELLRERKIQYEYVFVYFPVSLS